MVKQHRAQITRERVLAGAAGVFARSGYAGTSLNDIAAESGISRGAMYFHFTSKEQIARAIVDAEQVIAAETAVATLARASSAIEAVMGFCVDFARLVGSDVLVRAGVRLTTDGAEFDPPLQAPFADWIPMIAGLLAQSIEEGDVRAEHDPLTLARFVIPAFTGVQMVSGVLTGYADLPIRLREMWLYLLPVMITDERMAAVRDSLDAVLPGTWPDGVTPPV